MQMDRSQGQAEDERWFLEPMTDVAAELNTQSGWTWAHSGRVARYAVAFGKKLRLDDQQMMALQCAALLHDVGKMVVPPELLNKVSKLSRDEWFTITKHPMASAQIIKGSSLALQIAGIARSHHEWFNGEGYPMGLQGDAIPLGARILSLADACDAMSSDRPYRAALKPEEITREIAKGAGTQFDPVIVNRLKSVLQTDLNKVLPTRILRIVSDDLSLIQQVWFALYPHGWDIEVVSDVPAEGNVWDTHTNEKHSAEVFVLTIIDGARPDADEWSKAAQPNQTIWVDEPSAPGIVLHRPLDLEGLLATVRKVEEPFHPDQTIRILLADPYHLFRQALKHFLEENVDMEVVADIDSAIDFRIWRKKARHNVAVVASDMLKGTFTTGTLRPNDILLDEDETTSGPSGEPPVIVLVSDDDLQDPRLAARIWQPGAQVTANAFIYRGSPAEVVVEAIRTLVAEASWRAAQ